MDSAIGVLESESISPWAYMYVKALRERMIVLQYLEFIMLAWSSISQMVENASLSTLALKEQRFSVSNFGNMSVLLSTRYTVVQRLRAYKSKAESGRT